MTSVARLDTALVRTTIDGFPTDQRWESVDCAKLARSERARVTGTRDWVPLQHCAKKGGLYAFLFPGHLFSTPRRIALHAPQKNKGKQLLSSSSQVARSLGVKGSLPGVEPVQGDLTEFEERWTGGYIFENEWQSFRTRQDRKLEPLRRMRIQSRGAIQSR